MAGLSKRSFTIQGHRTSVALEPEYWAAFDAAVRADGVTPTAWITAIDEARNFLQEAKKRLKVVGNNEDDQVADTDLVNTLRASAPQTLETAVKVARVRSCQCTGSFSQSGRFETNVHVRMWESRLASVSISPSVRSASAT